MDSLTEQLGGETPESVIESHNLPELEYERDRAETAVKEAESNIAARQEALGDTNNMQGPHNKGRLLQAS
ncbi:predicted protein [Chaetomium globosum CBS 148.51]|uniref:Uncharacterized protein n=1 Tax=Chaetomium globosum (strain ATCC 6205 / CBS 148.51 / DSM 1962 / NBRC 6347 / NRRL 1970) TaxID=306901 RepID=Q2H9K9_CHAGB|nr:uncharacterized protein CHGG_03095 [Chaetomium globosum CBS 148.51]EAQ91160.1 predicted protein [Chaetomium globosum CBS 148.51]